MLISTSQKTSANTINWNNEITKKLVLAVNYAYGGVDLVGSMSKVGTPGGLSLTRYYDSFGASGAALPGLTTDCDVFKPSKDIGANITILAVFRRREGGNLCWPICRLNSNTNSTSHWGLRTEQDSHYLNFSVYNNTPSLFLAQLNVAVPTSSVTIGIGVANNNIVSVYNNGIKGTDATVTGTPQIAAPVNNGLEDWIGVSNRYPNFSFNGQQYDYMVAHWDRALSPVEIESLSKNPWQIFNAITNLSNKPIFVPVKTPSTTKVLIKDTTKIITKPQPNKYYLGRRINCAGYFNSDNSLTEVITGTKYLPKETNTTNIDNKVSVSGVGKYYVPTKLFTLETNWTLLYLFRADNDPGGFPNDYLFRADYDVLSDDRLSVLGPDYVPDYLRMYLSVLHSAIGVTNVPYTNNPGFTRNKMEAFAWSFPAFASSTFFAPLSTVTGIPASNIAGSPPLSENIIISPGSSKFRLGMFVLLDGTITQADYNKFASSPWEVFSPNTPSILFKSTLSITRSDNYPVSDITTTGWTSTTSTLANAINEMTFSDASFITSPTITGSQGPAVLALNTPLSTGTWDINLRSLRSLGSRDIKVSLLDAGGSSLAASSWLNITSNSFSGYTATLTISGTATQIKLEVQ